MTALEHALQCRAFLEGFAQGANPARARKRHQVDERTHADWRRGFDAGRRASAEALEAFRLELEADARGAS